MGMWEEDSGRGCYGILDEERVVERMDEERGTIWWSVSRERMGMDGTRGEVRRTRGREALQDSQVGTRSLNTNGRFALSSQLSGRR